MSQVSTSAFLQFLTRAVYLLVVWCTAIRAARSPIWTNLDRALSEVVGFFIATTAEECEMIVMNRGAR